MSTTRRRQHPLPPVRRPADRAGLVPPGALGTGCRGPLRRLRNPLRRGLRGAPRHLGQPEAAGRDQAHRKTLTLSLRTARASPRPRRSFPPWAGLGHNPALFGWGVSACSRTPGCFVWDRPLGSTRPDSSPSWRIGPSAPAAQWKRPPSGGPPPWARRPRPWSTPWVAACSCAPASRSGFCPPPRWRRPWRSASARSSQGRPGTSGARSAGRSRSRSSARCCRAPSPAPAAPCSTSIPRPAGWWWIPRASARPRTWCRSCARPWGACPPSRRHPHAHPETSSPAGC
jgi:hypothetical protein